MMYRLIFFVVFIEVLLFSSPVKAQDNRDFYSVPLIRKKSLLENIIIDNLKVDKKPPTNENITLNKYLDSEYYAEILVGKPGQKFHVIFDTTWGDMWIPSKLCSKQLFPLCGSKNLYDSDVSSTHIPVDPKPFELPGLVGNLTCDTVRLAHLNVSDLVFAEIREIHNTPDNENMYADGVIGLALKNMSRIGGESFFYKLLSDKKILKPIFSLYMNRDVTTEKGGTIFIGGADPKHIKKKMTYVRVIDSSFWMIQMNQFSIHSNKTSTKTFCNSKCKVVLDSGSNKIGVPLQHVEAINELIKAKKYFHDRYVVSCLKVNTLPTITLNIGGTDFRIRGRHYIQKFENGTNGMICMSAFCDSKLPYDLWSLGGGFLSSVYTEFDLENNRVGFVSLNN